MTIRRLLSVFILLLLALSPLFLLSCASNSGRGSGTEGSDGTDTSTTESSSSEFKRFSQVVSGKFTSDSGLFDLYFQGGSVYYEIPDSILGRDMLLVVTIAGAPEDYSGYTASGSKVTEMMVRWERNRSRLQLVAAATTSIAADSLPIARSVSINNVEPIIASFDIKGNGRGANSYLIDVTNFLLDDHPSTTPLSTSARKRFDVRRLDRDRSSIDSVKSFPLNVEAEYVLTFQANEAPTGSRTGALTFRMHQSMILLPADPMRPRIADPRVGWFSLDKIDFGLPEQKAAAISYIQRWRLEPSDSAAYARGELVEPVRPIVYYVDPATPEIWRPWVKKGIEDWNQAFEAAGFRNAIVAKDPPTAEEDPDFSPDDVRYSVVRWIANTTRNAVGPSVVDPRTGEIIESDVLFYHNHLRSYRNLYILENGAVDPRARSLHIPDSLLGEMLRAVIAHEVGHALGLPHNMAGSYAYDVDSLRSPSFTQQMGIAASIMDYARLNYVAQPGDGDVRLIRMMGPYDLYATNWGYRQLLNVETPEGERDTLSRWIREKGDDPIYRFGYQQGWLPIDPRSQTEDVGNNAMKASRLGIANLKRVLPNLVDWSTEEYNDYGDLDELYDELLAHWREMVMHVVSNVGGVYATPRKPSDAGPVFVPVPRQTQREAMEFLNEQVFTTPSWLLDTTLLSRIEPAGAIDRMRRYQISVLTALLDPSRMSRLIESAALTPGASFTLLDLFDSLHAAIWSELRSGKEIDVIRRNLQRGYIVRMEEMMTTEPENQPETRISLSQSDIRPAIRGELQTLKREITSALGRTSDRSTQLHLQDLLKRIEVILDPQR